MAKSGMAFQSAAVIDSQDLISQLPVDIIKHILLYLPAKDTARTSTLSQTWLHVWNSLPNASFEFNMPPVIYPFDNPEELQESMKFIDKSLSILREEKVMIQSFKLYMKNADHERYVPLIYDWISLVIKNYVKEIDLMSLNSWHGDSILRVVAIESLVNLKLGGSRIPKGLFCRLNTKLICLRKLYLKLVVIQKDDLQKLISCCPLLEKLKLECLLDPVDFLQCCCPKLKKLVVFSVDRLDIEAPNLEKLDIFGTKEVTVLDCCNVRELKIHFCDYTNKLIQELSPKFPILNKLEVISPGMGEKFEISNHDLQTLLFKNNLAFPFEIKIDAPKLSSFEYFGKQIPFLRYVSSSLNFTKVKLIIGPEGDLDTSWFIRLRDCLHKHKGKIEVNLFMQKTKNSFIQAELEKSLISDPQPKVDSMSLDNVPSSLDYAALIDSLFWSCRPTTLVVNQTDNQNENFAKFLQRKFLNDEEHYDCCIDGHSTIGCWQHYLKKVEVSTEKDMPTKFILTWLID